MFWMNVSAALAEQHRDELFAEIERYRLVKQVLAQQRRTGAFPSASRRGWWWFRKRHTRERTFPQVPREKQSMRMLIPYYPARDKAFVSKN